MKYTEDLRVKEFEKEFMNSVMVGNLMHLIVPLPAYVCTAVLHGAVMVAHLILRELIEGTASALHADLRHRDLPPRREGEQATPKYFYQLLSELKEVAGEELVNEVKRPGTKPQARYTQSQQRKETGPYQRRRST